MRRPMQDQTNGSDVWTDDRMTWSGRRSHSSASWTSSFEEDQRDGSLINSSTKTNEDKQIRWSGDREGRMGGRG